MSLRGSLRAFLDAPLPGDTLAGLKAYADICRQMHERAGYAANATKSDLKHADLLALRARLDERMALVDGLLKEGGRRNGAGHLSEQRPRIS